jgi:hypothetical protein
MSIPNWQITPIVRKTKQFYDGLVLEGFAEDVAERMATAAMRTLIVEMMKDNRGDERQAHTSPKLPLHHYFGPGPP